jgi:regulator of protease activity HflC (stomatin/prohibitin superfamily)
LLPSSPCPSSAAPSTRSTKANAEADSNLAKKKAEAEGVLALRKAEAEGVKLNGDAQASAIKAKSDALANTPNLVELTKAERWNGAFPTTMVPNATLPFMQIK